MLLTRFYRNNLAFELDIMANTSTLFSGFGAVSAPAPVALPQAPPPTPAVLPAAAPPAVEGSGYKRTQRKPAKKRQTRRGGSRYTDQLANYAIDQGFDPAVRGAVDSMSNAGVMPEWMARQYYKFYSDRFRPQPFLTGSGCGPKPSKRRAFR